QENRAAFQIGPRIQDRLQDGGAMKPDARAAKSEGVPPCVRWTVEIAQRAQIEGSAAWARALAGQRKDRRYYELVEDTIHQGFEYRYFVLSDAAGEVRAIQPFFIADQD